MKDQWGRDIDYLRISVTDRCNLRCKYCMPKKDISFMPKERLLTMDEMLRIAKLTSELGISKIRITGGEPLVREDIVKLVENIKSLENIKEVCMTTNGVLLNNYLDKLVEAGLDRINISLDSLKKDLYRDITGGGDLYTVLEAIERCLEKGLKVKLNTVMIQNYNDDEIFDFIEFTKQKNIDVRFIEMMPIGAGSQFKTITTAQIKKLILQTTALVSCDENIKNDGPANYYKVEDGIGRIGFISPMSHSFCGSCNRIRLTAEGFLKQCLHWEEGKNLGVLMRQGISDSELANVIKECIYSKPYKHGFNENSISLDKRFMFQIGG